MKHTRVFDVLIALVSVVLLVMVAIHANHDDGMRAHYGISDSVCVVDSCDHIEGFEIAGTFRGEDGHCWCWYTKSIAYDQEVWPDQIRRVYRPAIDKAAWK